MFQAMHVLLALTRSYLKGRLHIYLHATVASTTSLGYHACMHVAICISAYSLPCSLFIHSVFAS